MRIELEHRVCRNFVGNIFLNLDDLGQRFPKYDLRPIADIALKTEASEIKNLIKKFIFLKKKDKVRYSIT